MAVKLKKIKKKNSLHLNIVKWYLMQEKTRAVGSNEIARKIERWSALSLGDVHHKICALTLLLLFRIIGAAGAQRIVSTFEPLKNNERLAYNTNGAERHTLNLYAQDIRSLKTTRLLGS